MKLRGLVLHHVDARRGVDVTAVVRQRTAHQPGDSAIHLDGVDLGGAVHERVLDVDAAARTDDQDARARR